MLAGTFRLAVSLLLVAGACVGDKPGTTDTGGTSPGESSSTTDDATTEGPDSPTTAGGESTTGGATGGGETSGELDVDIEGACRAYCELFARCQAEVNPAECTAGCVTGAAAFGVCVAEYAEALRCVGTGYDCHDLLTQDVLEGKCKGEAAELDACSGSESQTPSCSESGAQSDTECSLTIKCEGAPTTEFTCDAEVCVCTVAGEVFAECPSEGVCEQGDQLVAKRLECCQGDI